ncbi:MAG: EfeM/EfeO family lipoprotein [Myxococcaceae bacterium]
MKSRLLSVAVALSLVACGRDPQRAALEDTKKYITTNLNDLRSASQALCDAAPPADADGWSRATDKAAVDKMKAEWKKARKAYERVEGAIAVLFGELDAATDERYDGFVTTEADANLFDGEGVTGVHAIERILWAGEAPARVTAFEAEVPNNTPPAQPANLEQATQFKTGLCARLVNDVDSMLTQFAGQTLDTPAAFRGVIGSIAEQKEKAQLAAPGGDSQEESRYAQYTLADMRANVEGGVATYEAFKPWLEQVGAKDDSDAIAAGLKRLSDEYAKVEGDALPAPPASWSNANPTAADLDTPFGKIYARVAFEANEEEPTSAVSAMNRAAAKLKIAELPAE